MARYPVEFGARCFARLPISDSLPMSSSALCVQPFSGRAGLTAIVRLALDVGPVRSAPIDRG